MLIEQKKVFDTVDHENLDLAAGASWGYILSFLRKRGLRQESGLWPIYFSFTSTDPFAKEWAYNPLFAVKLAKFANEIILYGQEHLVFETQYLPLGVTPLHLNKACIKTASIEVSRVKSFL